MPDDTTVSILVVDDDPIIRRILKEALEERGYRVLLASNGEQALRVFESHTADISLVLTDIRMPIMNGPTLVGELLLRGLPRPLPILFMSDSASQAPVGFVCIPKPIRVMQLMRTVEQSLRQQPDTPSWRSQRTRPELP